MQIVNARTDFGQVGKIHLSIHKPPIVKESYSKKIDKILNCEYQSDSIKLSVIVVAYNEGYELLELLESLLRQCGENVEIILVDNGLDEENSRRIQAMKLVYIKPFNNLGATCGRNVGVSMSKGEILLFLDADGGINDDLIVNTLMAMEEDVVAIRGKVLLKNTDGGFSPRHYDLGDVSFDCYTDCEGISAWRAELFKQAGGFEESVYAHDGIILNYRLHELYNVEKTAFRYVPSLVLYHDFHQNDSHLRIKVKNRTIIRKEMNLRYPFLHYFLREYRDGLQRHIVNRPELGEYDEKIRKINKSLKNEINEATSNIREEWSCFPESPQFSVIIPCYKLGGFLLKAINCIKTQTLQPVEIIVVDDASPDIKTIQILDTIKDEVKVIFLDENGGVAAARNRGIGEAKSEYILCLDADDIIEDSYLEKARNVFELNDEIGLVSCWTKIHGERSGGWRAKDRVKLEDSLLTSPLPTATCFRKSVWEKTPRGYDAFLRGYEDWDFWLSCLEQGVQARVIPEFLFNYLTRPSSKVKASNKNSYYLVSRIVENHKSAYINNITEVVAQQRTKINELSTKIPLKNKTIIAGNGVDKKIRKDRTARRKRKIKNVINKIKLFLVGVGGLYKNHFSKP